MKHLRPLSALILIVSELLLSAAKSEAPPNQKKTTNQAKVEREKPKGSPTTTDDYQNTNKPKANAGAENTYNHYGDFNYIPTRNTLRNNDGLLAVAAQIATVGSAIFTGAVVVVAIWLDVSPLGPFVKFPAKLPPLR
jgi:hypothetical protein